MKTGKLTRTALLTAAALIVYIIEAQIPAPAMVPGIKLGLSNIFTLFALYTLGPWEAVFVLLVRVTLGGLLTAQPVAILYSLSGGIPAFVLSLVLYKKFPVQKIWVLSVLSAMLHNAGQICMAIVLTGTKELILYLPILIISGIITGVFTGLCAKFVLKRIGYHVAEAANKGNDHNEERRR